MEDFTECQECANILNGEGGIKCQLYRYRKYIAGFVIGAIAVYILKRK